MSCDCQFDEDAPDPPLEPFGVDGNGLLTERVWIGGVEVIVHQDDLPETDVTTVDGIRCTTALRTLIDVAPDSSAAHLEQMLQDCLVRGLFSVEEAWRRLAEPDMIERRGAQMVCRALSATAP